jgi:hypothetical protein
MNQFGSIPKCNTKESLVQEFAYRYLLPRHYVLRIIHQHETTIRVFNMMLVQPRDHRRERAGRPRGPSAPQGAICLAQRRRRNKDHLMLAPRL